MTNDGLTRVQKVRHAMDRFDQFVRHPLVGLGNSSERKGFIVSLFMGIVYRFCNPQPLYESRHTSRPYSYIYIEMVWYREVLGVFPPSPINSI